MTDTLTTAALAGGPARLQTVMRPVQAHDLSRQVRIGIGRHPLPAVGLDSDLHPRGRYAGGSGKVPGGSVFAPPAGLEPATCRIDLERVGQCWLMTKTLVVHGIQRLPTLTDVGCHRRFSMSKRCIDLEIGTK
jgi:hypothetical protein